MDGCEELSDALRKLSEVRFDSAVKYTAQKLYNRAIAQGGTPVDTGELRQSAGVELEGSATIMGYRAEYAPHVEYGHRTRDGGYVPGQHYLQRNVETERPLYRRRLINQLKKVLG